MSRIIKINCLIRDWREHMSILKRRPTLFLGLGITILFLGLVFYRVDFIDSLELKFYDVMLNLKVDPGAPSEIVLVDIDEDSIEKLGRWPWPRSLLAQGIDKINRGEAKVIGFNLILSEPEKSAGLKELRNIKALFSKTIRDRIGIDGEIFLREIDTAQIRLDNDKKLATSITRSGKVFLPVYFQESAIAAGEAKTKNKALLAQSIKDVRNPNSFEIPWANKIVLPIPEFFRTAKGIGHIDLAYDMDGKVRKERLLYKYRGIYIPSYTVRLAASYLDIPINRIWAELGSALHIGALKIPTTVFTELLVGFKGPSGSFKRYSFFDVINDKVPLTIFKNKIVMVTPSAPGIMNPLSTPTDPTMPVGEFSAHVLWAILNKNFIRESSGSFAIELLLVVLLSLLITFIFPRLKAVTAGIAFVGLLFILLGGSIYFFVSQGLWVRVTYPLLLLLAGYIGVVSLKHFVSEAHEVKLEGESAETNRMLGLSFQSQGMLDMAFDKFRRVPVGDEMKDILYNLALDYERKRQFNKAASVYEYIEAQDSKFKDVSEKKHKLIQASETMVFGDGLLGGSTGDGFLNTGTDTRPTLGRYEVIKQLGKGAMGIVYLGQDPRINRTTAIKTFRFTDDFKPEEIEKMKETFFREAESAGTLSHPNIVTIYDAGDEQDLAFIAMEFLEGVDLEGYTRKDKLLPMRKVINYIADIADGLDYAHQKGVVHRDIKPANIMLLKTGVIKITDFGIARITATSQTQTGIVKGTPFYMSPEQFSGEKVDGRSDIFSLGVMFFQLLTGALPFTGDSPSVLMNKIMNVPHPDPRKFNPKILKPLVAVINNALVKDREKRYQKASQISAHLREIGKRVDAAIAKKKSAG